ncbi:hypothetical protein [Microbispora siamensis]|uniref:Uncharacterized protein n=1 Tax=Microbispora siamensis TaxID=564413 RepID=A0ABQ4GTW9_9ACTN|nr:hypothetical protein [Microbispora siamensis]GIH64869.1 hypothetical protein Msi02_56860 [Microbispora siamensis]
MGVLGGSVTYLYWSERRVRRTLEDNGIDLRKWTTKTTTPDFGGMLPQVEITTAETVHHRARLSDQVERALGETIVTDIESTPPGVRYARGQGSVVFGEFVGPDGGSQNRAMIYTEADGDGSIGVCLFGSMTNFADHVQGAEWTSGWGWTSSSAPEVRRFLEEKCARGFEGLTREELAFHACQVARHQGGRDTFQAWRRGFTYGDIESNAEWVAEIFYDVDLSETRYKDLTPPSRILIGAPLWIRTPRARDIRLYQDFSQEELELSHVERRRGAALRAATRSALRSLLTPKGAGRNRSR